MPEEATKATPENGSKATESRNVKIIKQDKEGMRSESLLRLKHVLAKIPVSKSTWWAGVKTGRFPKPIYIGGRIPFWLESEILGKMQRED